MSDSALRWRLILGKSHEDGQPDMLLDGTAAAMDKVLDALYSADRSGGLGQSKPQVNRWLGDIRTYFPHSVVELMQRDAFERLGIARMLLEPELLSACTPNVHLAAQLLQLQSVIPEETQETARSVVRQVVKEVEEQLRDAIRQQVHLGKSSRLFQLTARPDRIDWKRTIRANLKHYNASSGVIIPERIIGHPSHQHRLGHIRIVMDQSGSMATSVVYAAIIGSILANIRALDMRFIAFDTEVVDLTDQLHDPVSLLFGVQLGGGTHIRQALEYVQTTITHPQQTIVILISDLFEGGSAKGMLSAIWRLQESGCQLMVLPALSDEGIPAYNKTLALEISNRDIPVFACSPDQFAELLGEALRTGKVSPR